MLVGSSALGFLHHGFMPRQFHRFASPGEIDSVPQSRLTQALTQFTKLAVPLSVVATMFVPSMLENAVADEAPAPVAEKPVLGPAPTDFGLNYKDFYGDAAKVGPIDSPDSRIMKRL